MSPARLSCGYFPTTVIAIDDDVEFLKLLQFNLSLSIPCRIFNNSEKALHYLKFEYNADPFLAHCITCFEEEDAHHCSIDIDIGLIHQEIYNKKRFEQVSVLLVDYEMPNMSGELFSRQLKGSPFKIILLTGEANETKAIQLFNEGVIHRYVRKDDPNYIKLLESSIRDLQFNYFEELSTAAINAIEKKSALVSKNLYFCFTDPAFIRFFSDFWIKNKLTEYYLLEESGSILLLDQYGQYSWLLIKNEEDMKAAEDFVHFDNQHISAALQKAIIEREVLIHYFNDEEIATEMDLQKIVFPATKVQGKSAYYYSHVPNFCVKHTIHEDKIFSYEKFMETMPKEVLFNL